ncbi:hypothetical protein HDU93_005253 [Gonapodya sp. JEL0774]|nr:hypothetical protein HDU93_005253 [Gonapodya sp. JEL0774]
MDFDSTLIATGSLQVHLHIHDPLLKSGSVARRVALQIINLGGLAEFILTREANVTDAPDPTDLSHLRSQTASLIAEMRTVVEKLSEGVTLEAYLQPSFTPLFPRLTRHLGLPAPPADQNSSSPVSKLNPASAGQSQAHYHSASALNQVVAMSLQLRADVNLDNHKYMAHQLALLYQSLTSASSITSRHQPRIQREFESIKIVTSKDGQEQPKLSDSQREWFRSLTTDILSETLFSGNLGQITQGAVAAAIERVGGGA